MELREHTLTIGPHGQIKAEIFAMAVIVLGAVTGTITASASRRVPSELTKSN